LGRNGILEFLRALVATEGITEEWVIWTDGGILKQDRSFWSGLAFMLGTHETSKKKTVIESETSVGVLNVILNWENWASGTDSRETGAAAPGTAGAGDAPR
jgi:hypothetical protein